LVKWSSIERVDGRWGETRFKWISGISYNRKGLDQVRKLIWETDVEICEVE